MSSSNSTAFFAVGKRVTIDIKVYPPITSIDRAPEVFEIDCLSISDFLGELKRRRHEFNSLLTRVTFFSSRLNKESNLFNKETLHEDGYYEYDVEILGLVLETVREINT